MQILFGYRAERQIQGKHLKTLASKPLCIMSLGDNGSQVSKMVLTYSWCISYFYLVNVHKHICRETGAAGYNRTSHNISVEHS
jgi:hypothetical protein